jgi:hypothetical protein
MWAVLFLWSMEYGNKCLLISHPLSACYLHELWGGGEKSNGLVSTPCSPPPTHGVGEGRGPIFRFILLVITYYLYNYYIYYSVSCIFVISKIFNVVFINTILHISSLTHTYMVFRNKNMVWNIISRKFHPSVKGMLLKGRYVLLHQLQSLMISCSVNNRKEKCDVVYAW